MPPPVLVVSTSAQGRTPRLVPLVVVLPVKPGLTCVPSPKPATFVVAAAVARVAVPRPLPRNSDVAPAVRVSAVLDVMLNSNPPLVALGCKVMTEPELPKVSVRAAVLSSSDVPAALELPRIVKLPLIVSPPLVPVPRRALLFAVVLSSLRVAPELMLIGAPAVNAPLAPESVIVPCWML